MREYRDNMNEALENINSRIKNLPNVWSGNVGDDNYEILNKYANNFEIIINQITEYVDYLEKVKNAYKIIDEEIKKKTDESGEISILE
jgi:uncharacterized protein YukE